MLGSEDVGLKTSSNVVYRRQHFNVQILNSLICFVLYFGLIKLIMIFISIISVDI